MCLRAIVGGAIAQNSPTSCLLGGPEYPSMIPSSNISLQTPAILQVRQLCGGLASGSILPKPGYTRSRPRLPSNSPLDTPSAAAQEATHRPGDLPSFFDKILPAEAMGRRGIQLGRNTSRGWRGRGFAASALGA